MWSFGQGLFDGAADAQTLWDRLVAALIATEEGLRRPQIFQGFLHALHANNPALAAGLLDTAVEHETLAGLYPFLQVAFDIGIQDVARLKRSLALGRAHARMYTYLAYVRATDPIPAADLKGLVLTIAAMPAGFYVAVEVLHMRLHSEEERKAGIAPELLDAGCALMQEYRFTEKNDREDYRLGAITKSCLIGAKGAGVVSEVIRKLKVAVAKHETSAFYHDDLLVGLFSAQPAAALEGLCGGDAKELERGIRILRDGGSRKNPLAVVPEKDLLAWCDQEPQTRYPAIAQVITSYQRTTDSGPPQWTSIALRFLGAGIRPE